MNVHVTDSRVHVTDSIDRFVFHFSDKHYVLFVAQAPDSGGLGLSATSDTVRYRYASLVQL